MFAALLALLPSAGFAEPAQDAPTFSKDVAPVLFARCTTCHRPGGSGPFSLLEYDEAKKHARQIVKATSRRLMPPWLPVEGFGEFAESRRLTDAEIDLLARWAEAGAPEGDPRSLPKRPQFPDGWLLGAPDFVVEMAEPYRVAAEGRDSLRNFVMPTLVRQPRWVDAIEIRFDHPGLVHHATLQVDETSGCRQLDAKDTEPGFAGMGMGSSRQAGGHFVSWTPGKQPERFFEGTAWRLVPGTDLVLQLHLVPNGKADTVRGSVGLHFTEDAPTRPVYSLVLRSDDIDIPAGERDYAVRESFTLPVDALAVRIYPHAHYLGRTMAIDATHPEHGATPLLRIDDWNFDWQDSYLYARPVPLARGSTISMDYRYDNSESNPRNPNQPPIRVKLGNESSDEMGAFTLELLLPTEADRRAVVEAFERRSVARRPEDWTAHYNLALALADLDRMDEAQVEYREVLRLEPTYLPAGTNLANLLSREGRFEEAIALYERMLLVEPRSTVTLFNLGTTLIEAGETRRGIERIEQVIALQPERVDAHLALAVAHEIAKQYDDALADYLTAYRLDPASLGALEGLTRGSAAGGRLEEAERWARLAVATAPQAVEPQRRLASVLARAGKHDEAIAAYEAALALAPDDLVTLFALSRLLVTHPDPARRRPEQALALAERAGKDPRAEPIQVAECRANALLAAGRLDDAAAQLESALALVERSASPRRDAIRAELQQRVARIRATLMEQRSTGK